MGDGKAGRSHSSPASGGVSAVAPEKALGAWAPAAPVAIAAEVALLPGAQLQMMAPGLLPSRFLTPGRHLLPLLARPFQPLCDYVPALNTFERAHGEFGSPHRTLPTAKPPVPSPADGHPKLMPTCSLSSASHFSGFQFPLPQNEQGMVNVPLSPCAISSSLSVLLCPMDL